MVTLDSRAWESLFILEKKNQDSVNLVVIGDQSWKDWLGTSVSQAAGRMDGSEALSSVFSANWGYLPGKVQLIPGMFAPGSF